MNKIISPLEAVTSFTTAFKRSSNSPLYFAPATKAPISNEKICLFKRFSGTSPLMIRCAKPSAIAVLPTPGSPIRIGLFFVRRDRICKTRRISSSRPITGSNFPSFAKSVKFLAYLFNELYVPSAFSEVTLSPFLNSVTNFFVLSNVTPLFFNN